MVHLDRTGVAIEGSAALPVGAGATATAVGVGCAAVAEVRAARLRPAHHRAVKYNAASVTAQLATTLCATSVPMIRLTQNSAIRSRSMEVLSSACSADTENAPVEIHEGIGENRRQTRAQFKSATSEGSCRGSQELGRARSCSGCPDEDSMARLANRFSRSHSPTT
jgi:hypothetical protein